MSQIASFYLIKNNQRHELSDGNCSGEIYVAIWDYCEGELDIDCRTNAPQTEDTMDCVLIDREMAAELLEECGVPDLADEIAPEWDLPAEAVRRGLETLLSHLEQMEDSEVLLYEMA